MSIARSISDYTVAECERSIGQLMRQITLCNPSLPPEIQCLNMLDIITRQHASAMGELWPNAVLSGPVQPPKHFMCSPLITCAVEVKELNAIKKLLDPPHPSSVR